MPLDKNSSREEPAWGMTLAELKRPKVLNEETARLKRIVNQQASDSELLFISVRLVSHIAAFKVSAWKETISQQLTSSFLQVNLDAFYQFIKETGDGHL